VGISRSGTTLRIFQVVLRRTTDFIQSRVLQ
jgi:hypothetical protein